MQIRELVTLKVTVTKKTGDKDHGEGSKLTGIFGDKTKVSTELP